MKKKQSGSEADDIAIVGMAGIFPGAKNLEMFWGNIVNQVNSIQEVDGERWCVEEMFDPKPRTPDRAYSKWGGFLDEVAFDPTEFGIPPVTLKSVDPVQLLALKVARKALEDAGGFQKKFPKDRTAVIFGSGGLHDQCIDYIFRTMLEHYLPRIDDISEHTKNQLLASCKRILPEWTEDSFPGMLSNVISGRIANRLDLNGSNFTVDAACASSLAALDVGISKLRSGQADAAVVGAIDVTDNVMGFMAFSQTLVLSPEGKTRPFDDAANGIVISEGVAALVLKRLADAEKDSDHIYAVIKGIGSSSDGKNRSLTAPHPQGQVLALNRAYQDARISPDTIELIEAHGTGTVVGDQSEFKAMQMAFNDVATKQPLCAVGSVKSNIGHAKVAAGLAGIIKGVMAINHKTLPATTGIEKPNSRIDLSHSRFYLNTENRPWIKNTNSPRRCGVSAFGFGGTNFHVILEEYDNEQRKSAKNIPKEVQLYTFSSTDTAGLCRQLEDLTEKLKDPCITEPQALAHALYLKSQKHADQGHKIRLAVVAESVSVLKEKIITAVEAIKEGRIPKNQDGIYFSDVLVPTGKICFLFPGQGSQKVNMLKDLLLAFPECQAVFEKVDSLLSGWFDRPLSEYVYPPSTFSKEEKTHFNERLNNTQVAQPALAAADLTALDLLNRFGIHPNFSAGHSFGEFIALHAAGVIDLDDVIRLAAERGKLSGEASAQNKGKMAVLQADVGETLGLIKTTRTQVQVANINTPRQTVIGGTETDIDKCIETAKGKKLQAKKIPVTAAFHTGLMGPTAERLSAVLEKIKLKKPEFPVYSNTTGEPYPRTAPAIRKLLSRHIKEPLNFITQINNIYDAGARVFIEAGPGRVLSGLTEQILHDKPHTTFTLDTVGRSGIMQLAHFLAHAYTLNLAMDLSFWFGGDNTHSKDIETVLREAAELSRPSKMTWRIRHGKARPWHTSIQTDESESGKARDNPNTVTKETIKKITLNPRLYTGPVENNDMQNNKPDAQTMEVSEESKPLIHRIQANLDQFMEMQRAQQGLMERFLDMQQQLMNIALSGNGNGKGKAEAKRQPPIQSTGKLPANALPNKPPVPVLPKLTSSFGEKSLGLKFETNKAEIHTSIDNKKPIHPGKTQTSSQFQIDLLSTVSELTGYPEDMLALDAHLEADLGIDSIKRVEIFSLLEEHHPLLESHDSEAILEELANLNTLQKIIDWYNTNLARMQEAENISVKKK